MSVFRDAVQDCLDYDTEIAKKAVKSKHTKGSSDPEAEKFSGLRIRYVLCDFGMVMGAYRMGSCCILIQYSFSCKMHNQSLSDFGYQNLNDVGFLCFKIFIINHFKMIVIIVA